MSRYFDPICAGRNGGRSEETYGVPDQQQLNHKSCKESSSAWDK